MTVSHTVVNAGGGHTPLPWFPHGFTYPEGVKGDIFAKDSNNVLACTPICRVVEPISKMDGDLRRPPIDALRAIVRKNEARPTIEANAAFIVRACNSHYDLLEALEGDLDWLDALSQGTIERDTAMVRISAHRALIAKARGEAA